MNKIGITVRNILGCRQANFEIEPGAVVLVEGLNGAGKSSLAAAVRAAAAAEPNPLGFGIREQKHYKTEGEEESFATLSGGGGSATWHPGQGIETEGAEPVRIPPAAAGLHDFTARQGRDAVEMWESMFLPPAAELRQLALDTLKSELDTEGRAEDVADAIQEQGWKAVASVYEHKRREAKSEWAQVAGETYGEKKAASWRPKGWRAELDGMTPDQAARRVAERQSIADMMGRDQAVTEERKRDAEQAEIRCGELRKNIDGRQAPLNDARIRAGEARARAEAANRALPQAKGRLSQQENYKPPKDEPPTSPCPYPECGGRRLVVECGALRPHVRAPEERPPLEDRLAAWQARRDDAKRACDAAIAETQAANADNSAAAEAYNALRREQTLDEGGLREQEAIAADAQKNVWSESDEQAYQRARQDITDAREDERLVRELADAERCFRNVVEYDRIYRAVGPRGIRAQAVARGLDMLTGFLDDLCGDSKWGPVAIGPDYQVSYAGRPVQLCSESEQWKAQTLIQLAVALCLAAPLVVLDRADLLDGNGWRQLDDLANRADTAALILQTAQMKSGAEPDFWLEKGELMVMPAAHPR